MTDDEARADGGYTGSCGYAMYGFPAACACGKCRMSSAETAVANCTHTDGVEPGACVECVAAALADARREALEEAATFADEEARRLLNLQRDDIREGQWAVSDVHGSQSYGAGELAKAIRALATRRTT